MDVCPAFDFAEAPGVVDRDWILAVAGRFLQITERFSQILPDVESAP